ncbi:MAG TPA: Wzz/FepE/Etk N-terminal domain-containing protein [Ignavibacteriales bacterium]|nr:Wzz/FepE/Etk N-terminal domain-containing protein [Ignavibacteriales bacterium]HOM65673.1 Wzz/FepE/Etk N-terminal domain-containing protein [Ignavibacteriales bacterium]HPP32894.1 Wzz/FepE/Etk N-terminal domain-containing protein [Ignavibacteriales bacterium]HRT99249.1 Wzz/FepE/Etk N-terminal domain-containing protein [Ignavibacteriales bacterium]
MEVKNIKNTENIVEDEISITDIIKKIKNFYRELLTKKKQIISVNSIFFIAIVAYSLIFMKNYYTSTIEIFPETKSSASGLASLAALAGVSIPTGGGTNIDLFEKIIKSETVLSKLGEMKFYSKEKKDSINLYDYFEIELDSKLPKDEAKRKRFLELYEVLDQQIQTEIDKKTRVLALSVTLNDPKLSADVANALIYLLDEYIRTERKSYASNTRVYVEKRFNEVKDSLTYFENLLVKFRERNIITRSPELAMTEGRIRRQIEILQGIYLELTKQIELAKIEEIKDIPVVNVKEFANEPVKKAGPKRARIILVLQFVFFFFTIGYFGFKDKIVNYLNSIE